MRARLFQPLCLGLVIGAGFGCASSSTASNLPPADVTIVLNASTKGSGAFNPNPFTESAANTSKVVWVNADRTSNGYGSTGTEHHLVSDTGLFDSGLMAPGKAFTFTFPGAGTYNYHCTIHPTMVGTITITP